MEWLKQFARLFGWRNRQYESLHEWNRGPWKIRVWRTERSLGDAYNNGTQRIEAIVAEFDPSHKPISLHERLMALPNVACVAIVDANGNGVSAYPDWH